MKCGLMPYRLATFAPPSAAMINEDFRARDRASAREGGSPLQMRSVYPAKGLFLYIVTVNPKRTFLSAAGKNAFPCPLSV